MYTSTQYVCSLSFADIEVPEPSKEEIAINAERKGMEKKMNTLFKYILFHMLFMAAMLLISTGNQDVWNFRQNFQLRQMFMTDTFKAVSLHATGLSLLLLAAGAYGKTAHQSSPRNLGIDAWLTS